MNNLVVVIADEDEQYLMPIELKFIEEFEDKAEIIMITTRDYLQEYFSVPKKIDILIVNKSLCLDTFSKHDIENVFILTENEAENDHEIYKYTSVRDIYNYVIGNLKSNTQDFVTRKESTKLILVYSPVGGSGKTTIATGISDIISKQKKTVLFISTENLQSFGYLLGCNNWLSKNFIKSLLNKDFDIIDKLKTAIEVAEFHYLPPIQQAISVAGITLEKYIYLINKLKELNIYDYIIVDSTSELNVEKCSLMSVANKVVIVTNQDKMSVTKTDALLENIDCSDNNKFAFVCNKYNKMRENHLMDNTMKNSCIVKQYIGLLEEKEITLEKIVDIEELQNFTYSII